MINKITDGNANTIKEDEPVVHSTVDISSDLWDTIHRGMRAVVQKHSVFQDYTGVAVAGKTGTAQEASDRASHAEFIGFAPYDNPELAIAVRVANGYTSANAASIARDMISYYFKTADESTLITGQAVQVTTDNTRTD